MANNYMEHYLSSKINFWGTVIGDPKPVKNNLLSKLLFLNFHTCGQKLQFKKKSEDECL